MKKPTALDIHLKRPNEPSARGDDQRLLVDRLWPRGKSKEVFKLDHWLRDIPPSTSLRQWFGHDPEKWLPFRRKYFVELDENPEALALLHDFLGKGRVTFVFAAADDEHNNTVALRDYLLRQ